uniref:Uncharacterized protein n=1 Tax=Utricularia reniformis TaxID=192314 RepID=A0A1Y0B088_9LAMI|nr:hypothetical protein AEK19_MT0538 [Utricularia reniformis]ART30794.1 hypothetical protein AEK19_MT0538 [Utricularia reniformis]
MAYSGDLMFGQASLKAIQSLRLLNADSIAPVTKAKDIQSTFLWACFFPFFLFFCLQRCVLRHAYNLISQRVTLPLASDSNGYGLDGWSLPYFCVQDKPLSNRLIGDT